ncbi:MAG: hypothetical protein ABFS35_09340 [Bacteroidota bacterium]
MKKIYFILIPIFLLAFKNNDNLIGKFFNHCSSYKIEYYNFKTNGRFDYFAECDYKIFGQGNYQIKGDLLIFEYLDYNSKEKAAYDLLGYKIETHYSDTIHFYIRDSKNHKFINGVSINYKDSPIGCVTELNGQAKIERVNKDLVIKMIGYHDLIIERNEIINNGTSGFNVFLQDYSLNFLENFNDTVRIKTGSLDTLLIDDCTFVKNVKSNKIIICE